MPSQKWGPTKAISLGFQFAQFYVVKGHLRVEWNPLCCMDSAQTLLPQTRPRLGWIRNLRLVWTGCLWLSQNWLMPGGRGTEWTAVWCFITFTLSITFLSLESIAQTSQNPQAHDNLSTSLQGYGLLFPPLVLLLGSSAPQGHLVIFIPSEGLRCWFGNEYSKLTVKVGSPARLRTYWHLLDSFSLSGKHLSRGLCSMWDGLGPWLLGWDGDGDLSIPWWVLQLLSENVPPTTREQTWESPAKFKDKGSDSKNECQKSRQSWSRVKGYNGDHGQILDF